MYIEGSNHQYKGLPTYLVSPVVTKSICFTFWYHMHVVGDPKLNLYVKYEDGQEKVIPVWGMEGDQGNVWNQGAVPMIYNGISFRVSLKTCSALLYESLQFETLICFTVDTGSPILCVVSTNHVEPSTSLYALCDVDFLSTILQLAKLKLYELYLECRCYVVQGVRGACYHDHELSYR